MIKEESVPSGKKGVAISALGNLIPPVVGLATAPMLASALGPTGRGELAAATTVLVLFVSMSTLGLPQALIYYTARKGKNHHTLVLKITLLLGCFGILSSACIFILSEFLSDGNAHLAKLICFAGLAISPALILASLRGIASGVQAWILVASEKFISNALRLSAILLAYTSDRLTLETATLIIAITTFIGILAYVPLPRFTRAYEPISSLEPHWQEILPFSIKLWAGVLTGALLARLDQVIMLPLAGATQLGIYAVAVSIGEMALLFNYAVNAVMNAREAHNPSAESLAMAARISSLVTALGCVAIALLSVWAVPLVFGNEFSSVVPVIWILLTGIALGNAGSVVGSGLNGRGRPGMRSASSAIALVVNVVSLIILAPSFGAIGAAIATTVATIALGAINLAIFKRIYGVKIRRFIGVRRSDLEFLLTAMRASRAEQPTRRLS